MMHPKSRGFLKKVADLASQTQKIGPENMMKFFVRRISFALQNAIGHAINSRTRTLLGHQNFRSDRSFQDSVIVDDGVW